MVLVTFSFVAGDVVCDLVGNGLLSLDAIVDSRLELSEHLHYLVKVLSERGDVCICLRRLQSLQLRC